MSGYRPYMAGAREAAIRANRAAEARHRDAQYREYQEYYFEQRACGYEIESFEEWLGEVSPRQRAEDRMGLWRHMSLDDACYYGDTY